MPSNPSKRVKGISIARPILYGNVATPLKESEKTADTPPDHTHKWTVFVRDPNFPSGGSHPKSDLSYFIKKVVFKLHDTYPQPSRSIESPPFEVTETGWGEFEISIRIFFVSEANEKNIQVYHHLKLHPYGPQNVPAQVNGDGITGGPGGSGAGAGELVNASSPTKPGGPVESYQYDELVFNEPTEAMLEVLTSRPGSIIPTRRSDRIKFSQQTETEELDRLSSALEKVYQQVQKTKEHITKLESEQKSKGKDSDSEDLSAVDSD